MRAVSCVGLAMLLLGACNAILGNESDYRLDPTLAGGGEPGAGNQSSGGSSSGSTSKAGNSSVAGKINAGGSGDVGEAGSGGSGEPPECDPTSAEDCFNGFDDDCNGDVDCEDAACAGPAECVPVPSGAGLGAFLEMGSCPAGTTAVAMHQGLVADPMCTGCSCAPLDSYCDSSIVGLNCSTSATVGVSYNLFSNSCQNTSPANAGSIRFYSIRGFAECTPQGTPLPSPASWTQSSTFCQVDALGAGCPTGQRCVAKTAAPSCSIRSGDVACTGDYPTATGEPWSSDYVDERECGMCQCSFGISSCTGGSIQVFSAPNCQGSMVTLAGGGLQGDNCEVGFTPASGRLTGSPASTSCEPQNYPSGELKPKDSNTICCQ